MCSKASINWSTKGGCVEITLRQTRSWISVPLNDRPLWVSLDRPMKSNATKLVTTRLGREKWECQPWIHDRPHCLPCGQKRSYAICHKILGLCGSWRHHWAKCLHTIKLCHTLLPKKAQATCVMQQSGCLCRTEQMRKLLEKKKWEAIKFLTDCKQLIHKCFHARKG